MTRLNTALLNHVVVVSVEGSVIVAFLYHI